MLSIRKMKYVLSIVYSLGVAVGVHGNEVKQLRSASQQSGSTCGYYALANAHAIQKLFENNIPLTEQNIEKETETILSHYFSSFYQPLYDALSSSEKRLVGSLRQFAEDSTPLLNLEDTFERDKTRTTIFNLFELSGNRLKNAYVIQSVKDQLDCPVRIGASSLPDQDGRALLNIRQEPKKLVHFIYHMGHYDSGHWVYLGVVKEKNKEPYIIHLNSTNAPLAYSKDIQTIIAHLIKCMDYNDPLMQKDTDEKIAQRIHREEYLAHQLDQNSMPFNQKQEPYTQEDIDTQLARKLQEEEDLLYAQRLQASFNDEEKRAKQAQERSDAQYARRLQAEYNRMR